MRAIATLLIVVAPLTAAAQGVVRGTVRNKDGAPISGASIAIPGTTLSTRSDLQGSYRILVVPAGRVRVYAAAIGYGPVDTVVALTGGDSTMVDFTLVAAPLALPPVDVVSDRVPHFGDRPATSVAPVTERDDARRPRRTAYSPPRDGRSLRRTAAPDLAVPRQPRHAGRRRLRGVVWDRCFWRQDFAGRSPFRRVPPAGSGRPSAFRRTRALAAREHACGFLGRVGRRPLRCSAELVRPGRVRRQGSGVPAIHGRRSRARRAHRFTQRISRSSSSNDGLA